VTNQIHVSIGDDLKDALQAFADARGITIAAAVRIILHDTLKQE
jgi:antitoxin component of RelBE/YafQ-DinJ toxin-antitoxin module